MVNFIVLFFIFFQFVTNQRVLSLNSVDNFHRESDQILAVIDDILIALKINKNFKKAKNVTDYILIHNYVQDAVEHRNKKYKEIYNLTKTMPCRKAAYFISYINNAIGEMIREHKIRKAELFFNRYKHSTPASGDILPEFISLAKQLRLNLNVNKTTKVVKLKDVETRRIFHGTLTEIGDWPFVVSVHIADKFTCAGSIIREDLVLSAGSCFRKFYKKKVERELKDKIWIRAGSNFFNSGGVKVRAIMLHFHPKFNPLELSNNLVVIQLKLKLRITRRLILPIKIARMRARYTGMDVLGWGNKEDESSSVPHSPEVDRLPLSGRRSYRSNTNYEDLVVETQQLQHGVFDICSMINCISVYQQHTVSNRTFCAGPSLQDSGAGKFDLGGPGIIGNELQGVISFGPSGVWNTPTIFTKVFRYTRWLDSLFWEIPMTNDTVADSGQMNVIVELEPEGEKVQYTDESYILNEIKKDIQKGYRNQSHLNLPIDEDYILRKGDQDTPLRNNIYLDPNLVNSTEVYEKIKEDASTPAPSEPGDETEQVHNWVLYKEFMTHLLSNNSNDPTIEAYGTTEGSLVHSFAAETVSILSEMQEEYDAEYKEQNVDFEYNKVTSYVPNTNYNQVQTQSNPPSDPNNGQYIAQTEIYTPNISNNDKEKAQTHIVEFEYEDIPNEAQIQNIASDDPNNDKDNPQTQNVEFEYEDTQNNENPSNNKQNSNDLAEIVISDSGTTQKLLLNKKDPKAVKRFVNELSRLKDRIARTTVLFYREEEESEK